jgi:hypothetical protein
MPAFLTTIPLPPPASPTHVEPFATPAATHLNQKQNKMASDPCKQSEAMIKIKYLVELPTVCGALPELKARRCTLRAFLFYPFKKGIIIIVKGIKRKISPPYLRKAKGGSNIPSSLSVGQFW